MSERNILKTGIVEIQQPPAIDSSKPFTPEEDEIMEMLMEARNRFMRLPGQNKNAVTDFDTHYHHLQRVMGMRALLRVFPDYFIDSSSTV